MCDSGNWRPVIAYTLLHTSGFRYLDTYIDKFRNNSTSMTVPQFTTAGYGKFLRWVTVTHLFFPLEISGIAKSHEADPLITQKNFCL